MPNNQPLVSIGLPVYNGQNYVADAIQCAIAQTYTHWELSICDNASTDRTASICAEFAEKDKRIRLYKNEKNLGYVPNFNRAFQVSRGPYFKWITHDDLFGTEFVESCVQELQSDDNAVLAFPQLNYVDADGRSLRRQATDLVISGPTAESRVIQLMNLANQNTDIFWAQYGLIKRSILEQTHLMGLYNGSDQVTLLELAILGNFKQVDKVLFFRREHPAAATMKSGWNAKERARFAHAGDHRVVVLPNCRLLKEHLLCIWSNGSISFSGKIRCVWAVVKRFWPQWKDIARELVECPLHVMGVR